MALNILLILGGVVLLLWLGCGFQYYQRLQRLAQLEQSMRIFLEKRLNQLPLLLSLMEPSLVKTEDVFRKCLQLRKTLLFHPSWQKEEELTHQIEFLDNIAKQHPALQQEKRFVVVMKDLAGLREKMQEALTMYAQHLGDFRRLRNRSSYCLFPGYFLTEQVQEIPFHL